MKILVVEDSDIKYSLISNFLNESFPGAVSRRTASYQSGVEALMSEVFDVVILDMTLPAYDINHSFVGTGPFTFGGELILREMKRKRVGVKAIVLTQYDTFVRGEEEVPFTQLRAELTEKYSGSVLGCVRLDSSSDSWKAELTALIYNEHPDC